MSAFSLNKIMLIGNLGKDAETRFTTNDVEVTTFTLATSNRYKGKDGNWVDDTTWHNIVAFKLPDFLKENLKKGKKFYVEGRLQKREYNDKDGNRRFFTQVIQEKLIILESKGDSGGGYSGNYNTEQTFNAGESSQDDKDLPF